MSDDFSSDWMRWKPALRETSIPLRPTTVTSGSFSLQHPQGIRMRVHVDRIDLWASVTVTPPWWAFWRKPKTVPRIVASAPHEIQTGDILQLRNIGTTYQAVVQRRQPDSDEYDEERVVLEWKPVGAVNRYQGMSQG